MKKSIPGTVEVLPGIHVQRRSSSIYAARKDKTNMKRTAAADVTTEGLLEGLLSILSDTNGILIKMEGIEFDIHDAKAEGEPVSSAANGVISLLDAVRPHLTDARKILLERLDVMVPKGREKEE